MPLPLGSSAGPAGTEVPVGNWVMGVDGSGKVYLFKEGSRSPTGGIANAEHLSQWIDFGTPDINSVSGARFDNAMGSLSLTPLQSAGLIQAVDVGAIMQGGTYVSQGRGQAAGHTQFNQGQKNSASSAVFAPVVPGSNIVSSVANSITSTVDFLAWIAWIFHPLNLLRAVEFLTGLALMFYGFHTLMGAARRNAATHRTSARSIFNGLFALTPADRVKYMIRGRRQGKRDVAYRTARHRERGKQTGTTPDPRNP